MDTLKKAIDQLKVQNNMKLFCTYFETISFYYDQLSKTYKNIVLDILEDLKTCKECPVCCKKNEYLLNSGMKISSLSSLPESIKHSRNYSDNSKTNKAVLIVPDFLSAASFLQPPIDFLVPISIAKEENVDMTIIDNRVMHFSFEELNNKVQNIEYIIITTSPYDHIQNYFIDLRLKLTFKLIKFLKRNNENKTIIVCGAHGSLRPDIVLKETEADIVVRGEYDYLIVDLLKKLMNKQPIDSNYVYTQNDYCNNKSFSQYTHSLYHYNKYSNILPTYENINLQRYFENRYVKNRVVKKPNHATILASRGCYSCCSFCFNFWGNKVRYRSPQNIVDEMEILQKKHGVEEIFFIDATFTQNSKWVLSICNEIRKRDLKIVWSAETRCDRLNPELLTEMKKANCKSLWLGVESYCSSVLSKNQKAPSNKYILDAVRQCKQSNIIPQQFILIGLPGETDESLNETVCYLKKYGRHYTNSVMVATPRFGTLFYDLAQKQFPFLGNDFYSLGSVKGLVGNKLTPEKIRNAVFDIQNIK